jgi:hypothetical protein
MSMQDPNAPLVGKAAARAAEETVEAIQSAADQNDDPEVAAQLEDAAISAETTVSRVGWISRFLDRLFPPG